MYDMMVTVHVYVYVYVYIYIYIKDKFIKSSHPDSKGYVVLIKILLIYIQYVELYNNGK